jgi:hypothetical protein
MAIRCRSRVVGAVLHAIWHTLVEIAEIATLTVLGVAGLAAAAGIVHVVLRVRELAASSRAQRVIPARAEIIRLGSPGRDAIEAPYPRPAISRSQTGRAARYPSHGTAASRQSRPPGGRTVSP